MSRVPLVLALLLFASPAVAKPFSCAGIPWWVKNYSIAQINPVLQSLGMTTSQIKRVGRCLAKTNDPSYSIGP